MYVHTICINMHMCSYIIDYAYGKCKHFRKKNRTHAHNCILININYLLTCSFLLYQFLLPPPHEKRLLTLCRIREHLFFVCYLFALLKRTRTPQIDYDPTVMLKTWNKKIDTT